MFQTKAGPVLVAINPFKRVSLYGNEYIEAYKRKAVESPHVYAIADTAIREMVRGGFTISQLYDRIFSSSKYLCNAINL